MKRLLILIVFSLLGAHLVKTKPFVDNSLRKFGVNDDIKADIEQPYTETWKWSSLGSGIEGDESVSLSNPHRVQHDDGLVLVNVTADSVCLLHSNADDDDDDDDALIAYDLHYSSDQEPRHTPSEKREFDFQLKTITFEITKLRPNTNYHFQLLKKKGGEMAAAGGRLTVTTKPPAPRTHSSAFRQISSSDVEDRWVRVYWIGLPFEERNGNGFGYNVKIYEEDKYVDEVRCDASVTHIDRTLNRKRHTFAISTSNYDGESSEVATVEVPATDDVVEPNSAHVSFDKCERFVFECTAISIVKDRPICEDIAQVGGINDTLTMVDGSDWNFSVVCLRNKTSSGLM